VSEAGQHETGQRLLLIDTCGETAGVALCLGLQVLATEDLMTGAASAQIIAGVRRLLCQQGWNLAELDAVGVVGGPGSFTGVRTGLAAAKGLCEAANLRLAVVSRLAVLADASALTDGLSMLDAGRGELYVRDVGSGREWLCSADELPIAAGGGIVVAEPRVAERLAERGPVLRTLYVSDALPVVLQCLAAGGSDVALVEANYVRGEQNIYAKTSASSAQRKAP
jgi:tRNA threonylcarbamoyladenosine biosynthesis protein TsaB